MLKSQIAKRVSNIGPKSVKYAVLAAILALPLTAAVARDAQAAGADNIKFTVSSPVSEMGGKKVTNVRLGNMVKPTNCTTFWSGVPAGRKSWTWHNDGHNVNEFGLLFNFAWGGVEQTALKCVTIDPETVSDGDEVNIVLKQCDVGGHAKNPTLYVAQASGGATIKESKGSEKPCTPVN